MNPYLTEYQTKCDKILKLLADDLNTVKTGRAKPSLVENVKVNVYGGSWMEVRELGSITAPDPQQIVISLWDKSIIKDVVKGLAESPLKVNPVVSGEVIRINIPPLTEEIRRDLVKLISQKVESHKAMVRQERARSKNDIEGMKNNDGVSEDDIKRDLDSLQKTTDDTIAKMDQMAKEKEAEVMRV